MSSTIKAYIIAFLAVFVAVVHMTTSKRRRTGNVPYPPGPEPLPIVGNVVGINTKAPWLTYTEWAAKYGDIVYSRLLNIEIVTINSQKVAKELLEHRSHNYSDRPLVSINDLYGMGNLTAVIGYGNVWRAHRRYLHQAFRPVAAATHRPNQIRKARDLVFSLLNQAEQEDSGRIQRKLQMFAASTIMSIVYGYEVQHEEDEMFKVVEQASVDIAVTVTPESAALLVSFPFLKSIPSWLPGASFKRSAHRVRNNIFDMIDLPFKWVQDQLAQGTAAPCMVTDALRDGEANESALEAIKGAFATAFVAGAETSSSTLLIFFLAMILHPEAQKKAQAELDRVVGRGRLPEFDDRAALPYVDAVFRETLRWRPVIPLGLAHAASEDDVYEGYLIPKGATVMANAWAMSRDPTTYPKPSQFLPERFLTPAGVLTADTVDFAFGFGRRVCVGRYLADASVWSAMVHLLAMFDITRPEGVGEFEPRWTTGLGSHPEPFPCRITPRFGFEGAERLLDAVRSPV
ncbi:cytochrome P450 [Hygrophoropsis aurantiaca]|uniref:Cytochrome P450 n=1 Tax=Hygrophoropsis aurantiaca TaxID=72124 RepID=A0ACB8A219_9AGAM|nr:cytochrome P450 [Hygrophoropsis aurantiaca]